MEFVLDCSVALSWGFEEESVDYADRILEKLDSFGAIVPAIWPFEMANGLRVGERRQRLTEADSVRFVALLRAMPISVDKETSADVVDDALSLARRYGLSAYDAAYLELAMRRGCALATLDNQLRAAAALAGIGVLQP